MAQTSDISIAGAASSPLSLRSKFLPTEDVFVGVDPSRQAGFTGRSANVYIVAHKSDAQWTTNAALRDVTGAIENLTVEAACDNCWKTRGGSYSVRVRFAAVPSLTSADVWAEGGLDGLASSSSKPLTLEQLRAEKQAQPGSR